MSTKVIENEIRRLLASDDPRVVCLSGHWGVGKTFTWDKYLKEAKLCNGGIFLEAYSYVSLFGVNSLDELKSTIFFNSINAKQIGSEFGSLPSVETLKSNIGGVLGRLGKAASPYLGILTGGRFSANAIGPLGYLGLEKTIVCIDDIERRGDNLSARDVLGLISTLRDQKKCHVIMILNDDAIAQDRDKADFDSYSEKVIDISLKFAPTAEECAAIAIKPDTELGRLLAKHAVTLGISNIRVIKKIERFSVGLKQLLDEYEKEVLEQAMRTLVLMGWCVYEPKKAPSLEYLKDKAPLRYFKIQANSFNSNQGKLTDQEIQWSALMNLYEFTMMTDFDLAILGGLRNGYFDADLIREHASKLNAQIIAEKTGNPFRDAWDLFHGSFADNQDEILDAIYKAFFTSVEYLSPSDLNGTVWLLKNLGRTTQAAEVLDYYIKKKGSDRQLFDLTTSSFGRYVDEPDVRNAFKKQHDSFVEKRSALYILLSMRANSIPTIEDIELLAELPVDDFCNVFKHGTGDVLSGMIFSCLQFDSISNATEPMKEVARRAKEALNRIGQESPLNAMRLKRYGITTNKQLQQ